MHDDGDLIEFKAPKGVVPEDTKPGDMFDLVSTYRLKPSGEICLVMIGDTKLPGYEEGEYEDHMKADKKGYGDYVSSMHSARMSNAGGGAGNTDMGGGGSGGY